MFKEQKDFYPTPRHLIDKMLFGIDFKMIRSILEPSAGSGNIVEVLKEKEKFHSTYYNKVTFDIDCVDPFSRKKTTPTTATIPQINQSSIYPISIPKFTNLLLNKSVDKLLFFFTSATVFATNRNP